MSNDTENDQLNRCFVAGLVIVALGLLALYGIWWLTEPLRHMS